MDKANAITQLLKDAAVIYSNIEWNLGCFVGIAAVVVNPKLIHMQGVPLQIDVDGLSLDGFQCLGVSLLHKDRQSHANELCAAAKCALICEAVELAADFLAPRYVGPHGVDPA